MNKQQFFELLRTKLANYDQIEVEKSLEFYEEMINDHMDEGMSEEDAITTIGSIDTVVESILQGLSLGKLVMARVSQSSKQTTNKGLWITLAIIGSVVWLPLALALVMVVLSIYITLWAVLLSLYAVVVSFAIACLCSFVMGAILMFVNSAWSGLGIIGAGLLLGGLAFILIKPMYLITKQAVILTKFVTRKIKSLFIPRREKF